VTSKKLCVSEINILPQAVKVECFNVLYLSVKELQTVLENKLDVESEGDSHTAIPLSRNSPSGPSTRSCFYKWLLNVTEVLGVKGWDEIIKQNFNILTIFLFQILKLQTSIFLKHFFPKYFENIENQWPVLSSNISIQQYSNFFQQHILSFSIPYSW
jgi:hypothetical protein